jgi:hypothetical protein
MRSRQSEHHDSSSVKTTAGRRTRPGRVTACPELDTARSGASETGTSTVGSTGPGRAAAPGRSARRRPISPARERPLERVASSARREDEGVTPEDPPEQSVIDRRQQIEDLRQEFRAAQEARSSALLAPREPPRRLYHYTTLSGLVGITSSHSLWASDVRYMNDASELTYAAELISEVLTETLSKVENEVVRAALPPPHPGFANPFEYGMRPFAACFCEDGDLLSQWRGYRGTERRRTRSGLASARSAPPARRRRRSERPPRGHGADAL